MVCSHSAHRDPPLDDFKGFEEIVKREEKGLRNLGVYTEATANLGL